MKDIPFIFAKKSEIPEEFYSIDTEKPFTNCMVCDRNLQENGVQYIVEKAIKRYPKQNINNVLFEYAMCLDCAESIKGDLSEESMQNLQTYFENNMDAEKRSKLILNDNEEPEINEWISGCLIKGTPSNDLTEYVICGQFEGDKMLVSIFPYIIGNDAMEEMSELLSQKTLDELDDFMGKYFTGPPEIEEILKSPKFVLI